MEHHKAYDFQFVLILLLLSNALVESTSMRPKKKDERSKWQLNPLSKTSIKTIKDKDGEIFHCIDMYQQPAFDNPVLKNNHTIQVTTMLPNGTLRNISKMKKISSIGLSTKCPKGTVLIKQPYHGYSQMLKTKTQISNRVHDLYGKNYFAGVFFGSKKSWKYYGAQVIMDVFNISSISKYQRSSIQLVLSRGWTGPKDYWNTMACGWHVYPELYGDQAPRLYTFWTSDGYRKTGCYNLYCSGFIQLSRTFTPGMKLSIGKGVLKLTVYMDVKTLNWFLLLGEHEVIGYWPKEIFNYLVDISDIQVAGYVVSSFDENSPPMGNGIFPNPDPSKACELKHVKLLNENRDFIVPGSDTIYSLVNDLPHYYGVVTEQGVNEFSLSVGGPGGYKSI